MKRLGGLVTLILAAIVVYAMVAWSRAHSSEPPSNPPFIVNAPNGTTSSGEGVEIWPHDRPIRIETRPGHFAFPEVFRDSFE